MSSADDPVVIRTFQSPFEAELTKALLEEEEILCRLDDLQINALDSALGAAAGGIKLLVPPDLVEQALTVIEESQSKDFEYLDEDERMMFEYDGDWGTEETSVSSMRTSDLVCPKCQSEEVATAPFVHIFWAPLIGAGVIYYLRRASMGTEAVGALIVLISMMLTIAAAMAVFGRLPYRCDDCDYEGQRSTFGYELDE